ncbi:MAG: DUF4132 domain-containing protein [Lysobacterales bacterium]
MRRFECVEGGSSKFWEVALDGEQIRVRFGRIGTAGQTQTRACASAAAAQAEQDRLIREKTGKGYREVSAGAPAATAPIAAPAPTAPAPTPATTAPPPAVPPPLAPTPVAPAAAAPAEPVPVPAPTPVPAPAPELAASAEPQPPAQFLWTPAWRRLLAPWRGVDTPSAPPLVEAQCLTEWQQGREGACRRIGSMPSALAMLGAASPAELYALPDGALPDAWRALATQVLIGVRQIHGDVLPARLVWQLAAVRHGLPFALQMVLQAVQAAPASARDYHALIEALDLPALRLHCAAAAAPEYAELYAIAQTAAARSGLLASIAAYLFPTERALLSQALAQLGSGGESARAHLLVGCQLGRAELLQLMAQFGNAWGRFEVTRELLLTLARLGVPESLPLAFKRARLDHYAEHRRPYLEIARAHDSVDALAGLLERFEDKDARALLDGFAHSWPQLAIRLAAERLQQTESAPLRDWLQRFCAAERTALQAARARAEAAIQPLLDDIATRLPPLRPLATLAEMPAWLQQPLWRARKRPAPIRYPTLTPLTPPAQMRWQPGEQARWQNGLTPEQMREQVWIPALRGLSGEDYLRATLRLFGVPEDCHASTLAGARPPRERLQRRHTPASGLLLLLPREAARAVLSAWGPDGWYQMETSQLEQVIAWLDALAPPVLEEFLDLNLERALQLAQPLASVRVASAAASALRQGQRVRRLAQTWLLRHSEVAALALLPALGDRKRASDAQFALHWLLGCGQQPALAAAAQAYGEDGARTLQALQSFDPLQLLPARVPALPDFWQPRSYTRPLLADGRGLPDEVLDAIGEMLAFTPLEPRYAGLDLLRTLCTPASLGAFAWDLFQAWLSAGAPSKEHWAYAALAHLGDDACARQLARLIRAWPTEGASARAASGLDILAGIGSDVALMLLHGIAQRVKSKPLQAKAQARLEQLALTLGLSAEELADRLVPDLGLDEHGTLRLDYGPRQFVVGFDEHLKPRVHDASGTPLKDLPGIQKSDDPLLAEAASARYKALKKDVRTLASQQLHRLELAMVNGRRWNAGAFRRCLVEHPLLRHLSRRLLWGRFEDERLLEGFRVAEDLSYADADDALYTLAENAEVGLVHPLLLSADAAAAFGQIYADYAILQPFPQLGREVCRLSAEQLASDGYAACAGRKVRTVSVYALEARGWTRDGDDSGGMVGSLQRALNGDIVAELGFEPGYIVGNPRSEARQSLQALQLRRAGRWGPEARVHWSEVPPILISEVLRDIERLEPA